jgi:dienelactone hydrolase
MEKLTLAGAPALLAYASTAREAARRGTALVYHALGGDKSVHADDLAELARAGFLAVGVDAVGHGERPWPDAWERFRAGWQQAFLEVVTETVAEVPSVVDALERRGLALPGALGVVGVSLGGFVAYGAVLADRRLAAAVCVNASPRWGDHPRSPDRRRGDFFPTAVLSIVGGADPIVPAAHARVFHAALAPHYAGAPERQRLVELPGESHRPSEGAIARTRAEAVSWLSRFLRGGAAAAASP